MTPLQSWTSASRAFSVSRSGGAHRFGGAVLGPRAELSSDRVEAGRQRRVALGGDGELLASTPAERDAFLDRQAHLLPLTCKVPVIAVIKGRAAGLGWLVGASCDFMVCSEEGTYGASSTHRAELQRGRAPVLRRTLRRLVRARAVSAGKSYTGEELRERGPGHAGGTAARGRRSCPDAGAQSLQGPARVVDAAEEAPVGRRPSACERIAERLDSSDRRRRSVRVLRMRKCTFETFCRRATARPGSSTSGDPRRVELDSGAVRLEIHDDGIAVVTLCDRSSKNTFSACAGRGHARGVQRGSAVVPGL